MTSVFLTGNSSFPIGLRTGEFAYIASGAHLICEFGAIGSELPTDQNGRVHASNTSVTVHGAVVSATTMAITLVGTFSEGGFHTLEVGAQGTVDSMGDTAAVLMSGPSNYLVNSGRISGETGFLGSQMLDGILANHGEIVGRRDYAIVIENSSVDIVNTGRISGWGGLSVTNAFVAFTNHGEIIGTNSTRLPAVIDYGAAGSRLEMTNTGLITSHGIAISGSDREDIVVNTGTIRGQIFLRDGLDSYDGREGLLLNVGGRGGVYGGSGPDRLLGGRANEFLNGGADSDFLQGNGGDDLLRGEGGGDWLDGGDGDDRVEGEADGDNLFGGAGADWLSGGDGIDVLDGGDGNDTMVGGPGGDEFHGGAGFDIVAYFATVGLGSAVRADLVDPVLNTGDARDDSYDGIQGLQGADGNDSLYGDSQDNWLLGGSGNDVLVGRTGADRLLGNDGNDTLIGGGGAKTRDIFFGGAGADAFRFETPGDGGDAIRDFDPVLDRIEISAAGFGSGLVAGVLPAARFVANTTGLANAATAQITWETDVGRVWWDADGTGAGARVLLAVLNGNPAITVADLVVIA